MKHKERHFVTKESRRREFERTFQTFFKDVQIRKSGVEKDALTITCRKLRLTDEMMMESKYSFGTADDYHKAAAAAHFMHAYFNQYGITVAEPIIKDDSYTFYIPGAYRRCQR